MRRLTAGSDEDADEGRLVAAAKVGDHDAYAELMRRHHAVAFRAAFLMTGSVAEAEDAVQEACVKAWLALPRFRPAASFRPWFVRIAINEAHNRRRAAGRRAGLALRVSRNPGAGDVAPSAESEAVSGDQRARLAAAVGQLREQDQLVIAARYFFELSEAEAATVLGMRHGTVKSRLSRALVRLRAQLGEPDW